MIESYLKPEDEEYGGLKSPGRRYFLRDIGYAAGACLLGSAALCNILSSSGCKGESPAGPDIPPTPNEPTTQPATEEEGRQAIIDAATYVSKDTGYSLVIEEDGSRYTNRSGTFDVIACFDTSKDGNYDFEFACNYVTEGESLQEIADEARLKAKEILRGTSPVTDKDYITKEFRDWMKGYLQEL